MNGVAQMARMPAALAAESTRDSSRALPLPAEKPAAAPVNEDARAAAPAPADNAALQRAVEELNSHFSATRTDLKFSVDRDLGEIVVAVVDSKDGTVLRQIPSEEALRIARVIREQRSHLVEAVA